MIQSCADCPHHEVQSDPDPDDWFCSDDVKVECKLGKFYVTTGCRPFRVKRDTTPPPARCPLRST